MRLLPLLLLLVPVTTPSCSSGGRAGTRPEGGLAADGGTGADGGSGLDALDAMSDLGGGDSPDVLSGSDGALGPDDVDDDLPVPLAAGIAATPPMGWNSWNAFPGAITETLVERVADAMVSSGMKDAGYQYINIDDGWAQPTRAADGTIQTASSFPNGIKAVADYVHALGLKFGIYSDRGTSLCSCSASCSCQNGSLGREAQDALSYAAWGADYLKYDNCCAAPNDTQVNYQTMGSALSATGRPFVYSLCAWAFYEWGVGLGNLWRTTGDIQAAFDSFFGNAMTTRYLAAYAGPNKYIGDPQKNMGASTPSNVAYGWNDPDMLEVGNPGLTDVENQTHFSLWAITDSPLIAGNDLRTMTPATKRILTDTEVIAINQDHLGLQGFPVHLDGSAWAKPLNESGARAVVLVNPSAASAVVSFQLPDIGLREGAAAVRDLVAQKDLGEFHDSFGVRLLPHASATLKVSGTEPRRPYGTAYLSDLIWTYAANGLGGVHKDESNTSSGASGTPISLRGTKYPKGLGVDAPSMIIYRLAQKCTSFSADIGVDDAAGGQGSVVFQVWADGEKLFDSTSVTGTSAVQSVRVSLDGKRRLKLLVTNAGDGNALDRADWANAQVVCAP